MRKQCKFINPKQPVIFSKKKKTSCLGKHAHSQYVTVGEMVVSSYKESRNDKPMYGSMLPNLSPSPNLYKVQSVYNNNVAS